MRDTRFLRLTGVVICSIFAANAEYRETDMRCAAADTLCRVLEFRHAISAHPPGRWLCHRTLAPLLRCRQRCRAAEPYSPAVPAHRPPFAVGDGSGRHPLVCGAVAGGLLRVSGTASGRVSRAGDPSLLAAGSSRVLNRFLRPTRAVHSSADPVSRKDSVLIIQ